MTNSTNAVGSSLEALLLPLQTVVAAWAANDLISLERIWTDDADLIAYDGTHLIGRREICAFMRDLLDGPLKNTRLVASPQRVRTLSNDVGIVHAAGGLLLPGESIVSSNRHTVQTFVLSRVEDRWLIDACQSTGIMDNESSRP